MYKKYENLFGVLEELGIGFVAFSPLANGFLSAKYNALNSNFKDNDNRSKMAQFKPENITKNAKLLELLNDYASRQNATPAQIGLAYLICKKPFIVPIPGSRDISRVRENFGAIAINLSHDDVRSIDSALADLEISEVYDGFRK